MLDKARHLLNVRGFSQKGAPMFGCLPYPACVEVLAKRAIDIEGTMHTKDLWSESEVARELELKMRLVPGLRSSTSNEDDDQILDSAKRERKLGVPHCFVGFSVTCFPKVLKYALLLEVPNLADIDLVVAHLRLCMQALAAKGMPHAALKDYVQDEQTVATTRSTLAVAQGGDTTSEDIKVLGSSIGYLSGCKEWKEKHGALPAQFVQIKSEISALVAREWQDADPHLREVAEKNGKHPKLTLHSYNRQVKEREQLDTAEAMIAEQSGGRMLSFNGDGGLAHGPDDWLEDLPHVLEHLKRRDMHFSIKVMPQTEAEWRAYTLSRHPGIDLEPVRDGDARWQAWLLGYSWLHDKGTVYFGDRAGEPHVAFSQAIANDIDYNVCRQTGKVEYCDPATGIWFASGGEYLLSGQDVIRALQRRFGSMVMRLVWDPVSGKYRNIPVTEGKGIPWVSRGIP